MVTDWILIRRAAVELGRELRGGRVVDAGLLDDGRFGIKIAGRKGKPEIVLAIDLFGSPPLVSLEELELSIAGDPGWSRSLAVTLRSLRFGETRSRRGDRVMVIDFGTTSRFGVESGAKLVLELIPRFGNALLLRDSSIIAAAKQFSPAENETRSVGVGHEYQPPPLRQQRLDAIGFAAASMNADDAGIVRAFGAFQPDLPKELAVSLVTQSAVLPWQSPGARSAWLTDRAAAFLSTTAGEPDGLGPIHVYRDAGKLVAMHVVPLAQYAHLAHETAPALLPLFREARETSIGRRTSDAGERKRAALTTRITKRRADIEAERAQVIARRDDAAGREKLRIAGDALYTYAPSIPAGATTFTAPEDGAIAIALDPDLDAKANAARYFARYRKAADALPHLERRLELLTSKRDSLDELAFETERADNATLGEITTALEELDGRTIAPVAKSAKQRKAPLRIERPSGARIFVGRSPRENVDVTFRIARPDDLWFHARGIPGSHVVLQPPPGDAPTDDDLTMAADLAAQHSRAKNAPRVEIDFTERKYVRKQRDGAPGLVWYTNARTRVGRPDQSLAG